MLSHPHTRRVAIRSEALVFSRGEREGKHEGNAATGAWRETARVTATGAWRETARVTQPQGRGGAALMNRARPQFVPSVAVLVTRVLFPFSASCGFTVVVKSDQPDQEDTLRSVHCSHNTSLGSRPVSPRAAIGQWRRAVRQAARMYPA